MKRNGRPVRALLEAGIAAHRNGDLATAVDHYRQAVAADAANADARNLLGAALLQLGKPGDAVPHLEKAVRNQRGNPGFLANLAQAYLGATRPADAADAFRRAARIEPDRFEFQLGLAAALAMQKKLTDAETLLKRLTTRFPAVAAVWFNLGNVMRDLERRQEAIDCYRKAVELDPGWPDARNNLGSALHAKLRFAEAEEQYRECIRRAPDHLLARLNLTSVLIDTGRFPEAEETCRALLAVSPDAVEIHRILGAAVGHQGRLLDAHAIHAAAARLEPESPKATLSLAMSSMETGRPAEGLRLFSRALKLAGEIDAPRQLLASALLAHGALQDGWDAYGSRPYASVFRIEHPEVPVRRELAAIEPGRERICVLQEQGLGDELFFLRYAPALAARGAVIAYRGSRKLSSLLSRVDGITTVLSEDAPLPPADQYILAGDLPHALGCRPYSPLRDLRIPASAALPELARRISIYWPAVPPSLPLGALPAALSDMRERLAALGPPPYIAITWRAGTLPEEQQSANWVLFKSVDMEALARALAPARATLVALQRRPEAGEIDRFSALVGRTVHDLSDLNEDLEAMLAALSLIDDYVGVSNTNMHLRIAAGRTARVLVPAPGEWRWLRHGASSPWFPGFAIYRQTLQGNWAPALAALERDLGANFGGSVTSNTA
jgi:tetratricopeptide (TPR) repeat protein